MYVTNWEYVKAGFYFSLRDEKTGSVMGI